MNTKLHCPLCHVDIIPKNIKLVILKCGHKLCEECVKNIYKKGIGFICPEDGVNTKRLDNMISPLKQNQLINKDTNEKGFAFENSEQKLFCHRHKKKQIIGFCRDDNCFPCNLCYEEHKSHNIEECNITQKIFWTEIKGLENYINNKKQKIYEQKKNIEDTEKLINDYYKMQIKSIEMYFDKYERIINSYKKKFISQFTSFLSENYKQFSKLKDNLNETKDVFDNIYDSMNIIKKVIYAKGEYELFYLRKKEIKNKLEKQIDYNINKPNTKDLPKFSAANNYSVFEKDNFFGVIINKSYLDELYNNINSKYIHNLDDDYSSNRFNEGATMTSFFKKNHEETNIFKHNLLNDKEPTILKPNIIDIKNTYTKCDTNFDSNINHNNVLCNNISDSKNISKINNNNNKNINNNNYLRGNCSSKANDKFNMYFHYESNSPKRLNSSTNKDDHIRSNHNRITNKFRTNKSTIDHDRKSSKESSINKFEKSNREMSSRERLNKLNNVTSIQKERANSSKKKNSTNNHFFKGRDQPVVANSKLMNSNINNSSHNNDIFNVSNREKFSFGINMSKKPMNKDKIRNFNIMSNKSNTKEYMVVNTENSTDLNYNNTHNTYDSDDTNRNRRGRSTSKKSNEPIGYFRKKKNVGKFTYKQHDFEYS